MCILSLVAAKEKDVAYSESCKTLQRAISKADLHIREIDPVHCSSPNTNRRSAKSKSLMNTFCGLHRMDVLLNG